MSRHSVFSLSLMCTECNYIYLIVTGAHCGPISCQYAVFVGCHGVKMIRSLYFDTDECSCWYSSHLSKRKTKLVHHLTSTGNRTILSWPYVMFVTVVCVDYAFCREFWRGVLTTAGYGRRRCDVDVTVVTCRRRRSTVIERVRTRPTASEI